MAQVRFKKSTLMIRLLRVCTRTGARHASSIGSKIPSLNQLHPVLKTGPANTEIGDLANIVVHLSALSWLKTLELNVGERFLLRLMLLAVRNIHQIPFIVARFIELGPCILSHCSRSCCGYRYTAPNVTRSLVAIEGH